MNEITKMVKTIGSKAAAHIIVECGTDYEEEAEQFRSAETFGQLNAAIEEQNMSLDFLRPCLTDSEFNLLS